MEIRHTDYLDLHVDLDKFFRQRIYLYKSRVDRAVEATEFGDQTDISLADWLVWVGADNAAWDSTAATNEGTEGID